MEREKIFLDMTSSMNDVDEEELRFDKALLDTKDIESLVVISQEKDSPNFTTKT